MNQDIQLFTETVWNHYAHSARDLPWRRPEADDRFDPYKIMVSEMMLQQTQVSRVIPKYQQFLEVFPDVSSLAAATFGDVLRVWTGLGYNRRAKFLHQAAQEIQERFDGAVPSDIVLLESLPGIGKNTAAAIRVYAFNEPEVFIETNIRTVFIHHFFAGTNEVHDKDLLPLITESLDRDNPREWYWALMDYGTFLKTTEGNVSRRSTTYKKQSTFEGSRRQLRAWILRQLLEGPKTLDELAAENNDTRLQEVLSALESEKLITMSNKRFTLP